MNVKTTTALTLGTFMILSNGIPAYAKDTASISNVAELYSGSVEKAVQNVGNQIQGVIDGIQIEEAEPVDEVSYTYVQQEPVYTYTIQETVSEPVTMTVEEFLAMYGLEETVEAVPVDTSVEQAAYEQALANYNTALAAYEAANQIIETTKEIEVEITEEVTDEEGNVTPITHTEIQTVTEMIPAGDVETAKANLDAAKAALDNAQMALDAAQAESQAEQNSTNQISDTVGEPNVVPSTSNEEVIVNEEVVVSEEITFSNSGTCGDNLTWTLDDEGILTISGSGEMESYYSTGPWGIDVKKVVIENGVTSIGDYAFSYCESLTEITIPETVTTIGNEAFSYCSKLKEIIIPNSVTTIGNNAFSFCFELTEVILPNIITKIGSGAFLECGSLKYIELPGSITVIEDELFSGCGGLTYITIPTSVRSIGDRAFSGCSLKEIYIPQSVTSIGDYAFSGCDMKEITIPEGITSIKGVFSGCMELTDVTIPDSVTSIGDDAFGYCYCLTTITIPDSVTELGDNAFYSCYYLSDITFSDNLVKIGKSAFEGCSELQSIAIPNTVTSIGSKAFYACKNLTDITLSNNLKSIGSEAFDGCAKLTSITIPDSVSTIGNGAFKHCDELKTVNISNNVTNLSIELFYNCTNLESVTIPEGVTKIGNDAFYQCWNLKDIILPNSLTSIGRNNFTSCTSLENLLITDNVTSIGNGTFKNCPNLTLYVYPNSTALTYAENNAIPYVIYYPVESLVIKDMRIPVGTKEVMVYTITPDNCTDSTVTWTSSNDEIASIDENGVITAKRIGTVTITGSTYRRPFDIRCTVNVVILAESISLDKDHAFVQVGSTVTLNETVLPYNTTDKSVTWTSSNTNIATIYDGIVTGVSDGLVTITAITNDGGYSASADIYVYTDFVPVEEILLDKTELSLYMGTHDKVSVSFNPEHPTNTYYIWESEDPSIATVEDGVVTAVRLGTTVIKAISEDGNHVAECTVEVYGTLVDGVTLDSNSLRIEKGDTAQLVATVSPDNASIKDITWSSSDESVAKVDENGVVTTLNTGTTIITVTTLDGGFTAECEVTVFVIPVEGIELDKKTAELTIGESDTLTATIHPEDPTDDAISWTSSNPSVVSVDNGVITALTEGTGTVSVITRDGFHTADCVVTVKRIPVRNISFEQDEIELVESETDTLHVIVTPDNATYQSVSWMSDDTSIVTVDDSGNVTAIKAGIANIYAISDDGGFSAKCKVNVIVPEDSIAFEKNSALLAVKDTVLLEPVISPHYTSGINWTSSNTKVATVADGIVKGISAGTAVIRATNSYGRYAECMITVYTVGVTGIELSSDNLVINLNETKEIIAKVLPENATNKNVVWTSSNENVAKVTNGIVSALAKGSAVITAATVDGNYTANCLVEVKIPVKGVDLDKKTLELCPGETHQLFAIVLPADASNKNIIWTSSNESVATVADGIITAVGKGTATITVSTEDGGFTAACEVTVNVPVDGISLDKELLTLNKGANATITATVSPKDASNKNIIWTSSNESVATVADGLITAVGKGIATITVSTEDGGFTAACKVTVNVPVDGISLDKNTLKLDKGSQAKISATVTPTDADNKNVIWTSSNEKIAIVTNGIVSALSKGNAIITAATEDGKYKATCTVTVSVMPFEDVPNDAWYYSVAKECYETGLISGTSATTFSPMQEMTRAMVVTILWRMEGQPNVDFNNKFKDVSSKQWYATSISWAEQAGVVNGYGDGTFKPDAAVTREQVAVMLANYATYKGVYVPGTKKLNTYPDGSQVSTWAQSGMKWALTNGIISGNGEGYLRPKKSATRAEGAAMLLRMKNWL